MLSSIIQKTKVFISLFFTVHNLHFLYHFFAKVEEKKEFLTTRGRIWMTIYGQLVSLWAYQVDTSVVHACGPAAGSIRSLSRTKTGSEGALARKCREMVQTGETWSQ